MPPKKKQKQEEEEPTSLEAQFDKQLEAVGLGDALQLADEVADDYECESTGWVSLDQTVSDKPENQGLPLRCHSEWYSEEEHVGKTSALLQIGVSWQRRVKRVGIIDIEPSIKLAYLKQVGFITSKEDAEKAGLYAVRLLQPQIKAEDCATDMVYVEKVLNVVSIAANYFDLLIIDSVDALITEADAAKPADESGQMGGVAKPLKAFMRKNTLRRAHCAWINHMSQGLGQYAKAYTTGGKAIPRYSSLRVKIARVEWLKDGDTVIGFTSQFTLTKNRLGPAMRSTRISYIYGEGFSVDYDYFTFAIKNGILLKSGAWYYVPGEGKNPEERKKNCRWKCQGLVNSYRELKYGLEHSKAIFAEIKKLIDGEDVSEEEFETAKAEAEALLAAYDVAGNDDEPEDELQAA